MIPKTFAEAFTQVKILAYKFTSQIDHYLESKYQEAEVRQEFLDKFFVALGWDVYHDEQPNPYEREVRIEKSVMVGGRGKRADYAFYTAPNFSQVRFMAEAKKPSRQLENAQDCFQAIRYGWNSNAPISVLTDFEQFLILDSRYKPNIETATDRILKKFSYNDYADEEKFKEIYYLFSREAVGENALEDFALSLKKGRGARQSKLFNTAIIQPIDEEFLAELDEQRLILAKAFKKTNPQLDGETLTEITQRTLDRLVFLRFLEDKLVEPDSVIDKLGEKSGSAWRDFIGEMPRLNSVYNGTLFRKHEILDNADFAPDDRAFKETRDWLSHLNSPYDFNSIPIHILGSIYERFLGKTIETTDKRASVVDKPEVRKAGGVYYTPEYIVRYIVENTIGKLIEKKKPEDIAKMRFADIACGSGSFLLGVFDYLIAYHVEWFSKNKTRREQAVKQELCRETPNGLQLTIQYKREILLNNIYGVDLDAQAKEVAQLSLYLKLLEEETTASANRYLTAFRNKLLPPLDKNIVHGNSLIDYDIMDGMLFDTRELKQLNPMNFQSAFPEVFKNGGFDAIVGNPPYVRIQGFPREQIKYFSKTYKSSTGNFDIYVNFIERAYNLLKSSTGILGEIIPNKFIKTDYGIGLRNLIAKNKSLSRVVDFGANQVFDATTYTCLLFLSKDNQSNIYHALSEANIESLSNLSFLELESENFGSNESDWLFVDKTTRNLLEKLEYKSLTLLNLPADMSRGSSSGDDKVFIVKSDAPIEDGITRIPIFATDFNRYKFNGNNEWKIIFPYEITENNAELISEQKLKTDFPDTYKYLHENKNKLEKRKQYREWFGFSAPRNLVLHDKAQIIIPLLANRGIFSLLPKDEKGKFCPMASGGFTITLGEDCNLKPEYVLGLLNSKLLFWKLENISNIFRGGWITCTKQYVGILPIRTIDFGKAQEKAAHDRMVELVEKMLGAKESLAEARTDKDKTFFERYCSSLDAQIDALVYELYELTPDEIGIVEQNA